MKTEYRIVKDQTKDYNLKPWYSPQRRNYYLFFWGKWIDWTGLCWSSVVDAQNIINVDKVKGEVITLEESRNI